VSVSAAYVMLRLASRLRRVLTSTLTPGMSDGILPPYPGHRPGIVALDGRTDVVQSIQCRI
jgi:hypothetical protein